MNVAQCTEVEFISFLPGEFTTYYHCNKSTGQKTGDPPLCNVGSKPLRSRIELFFADICYDLLHHRSENL